jgi:hypothetical protein
MDFLFRFQFLIGIIDRNWFGRINYIPSSMQQLWACVTKKQQLILNDFLNSSKLLLGCVHCSCQDCQDIHKKCFRLLNCSVLIVTVILGILDRIWLLRRPGDTQVLVNDFGVVFCFDEKKLREIDPVQFHTKMINSKEGPVFLYNCQTFVIPFIANWRTFLHQMHLQC